ncbi:MAG: hypothetical protein AAB834_07265, partial [Patescibacteria group bacterium]
MMKLDMVAALPEKNVNGTIASLVIDRGRALDYLLSYRCKRLKTDTFEAYPVTSLLIVTSE